MEISFYLKKSGSIAVKYPNLAEEWHPIKNKEMTPHNVTSGSNMKIWSKCDSGHEWEATISNRTGRRSKCPICSAETRKETFRKTVLKRSGSLADVYPDLAKKWHPTKNKGLTPNFNIFIVFSNSLIKFICEPNPLFFISIKYFLNFFKFCFRCSNAR